MIFTRAELKASRMVQRTDGYTTDTSIRDIHADADEIIMLAAKIKAERATAAMGE